MSVRFVLGRAGSGKSAYIRAEIQLLLKQAPIGDPILLFVPRQATFESEKRLAADSPAGGYSRLRVLSFEQFGHDLLAEVGAGAMPITESGRRMILGHILRQTQAQLKFFSASATKLGLADDLDATFAAFERAGVDPAAIPDLLSDLAWRSTAGDATLDKLHDLQLVYQAYSDFLGQNRVDPQRRLKDIADAIAKAESLKSSIVFVDGFQTFTSHERDLIVRLCQTSPRVEISLTLDPAARPSGRIQQPLDDFSPFHQSELTLRKLNDSLQKAGVRTLPPRLLKGQPQFQSAALRAIEERFFDARPTAAADSAGVEMIEAIDRRAEVNAVARRVRKLLQSGSRLRNIAVLMRNLDDYIDLIDEIFPEHRLAYFVDRRRKAGHHAVVQMIRSALQIALNDWPIDCVMQFIRCGLAGITLAESDELENYALAHRISGPAWAQPDPWHYQRHLARGSEDEPADVGLVALERIHDLRMKFVARLATAVTRLQSKAPRTVKQIIVDLFSLIEGFNVRGQLVARMRLARQASHLEERAETEQVWTEITGLFSEMIDLLGDEPLPLATFVEILDRGLEGFDLAITPQAIDELLVGDVARTRPSDISTTFVLGLSETVFPRAGREDGLFSDRELRWLSQKIELGDDSRRQTFNERFLGYQAFTRASERLILSRSMTDASGRPTNPSSFWMQVRRILPGTLLMRIDQKSGDDLGCAGSMDQSVRLILRWIRHGADPADLTAANVYQWLSQRPQRFETVWSALQYDNTARLSPENASGLFPAPLVTTAREIESFAACPFQHFVQFGLKLEDRPESDVTGGDLSGIYHRVLHNVMADALARQMDPRELQPDQTRRLIQQHIGLAATKLKNELMLSTARNRYLLDRIEQNLEQVLRTQIETARRGSLSPAYFGVDFQEGGRLQPLALQTPKGRKVQLTGRIDRIDINPQSGIASIIDYTLAGKTLNWAEAYYGLSVQLLVYLLVIRANGNQLDGKVVSPVAGFYCTLLRLLESVKHPNDAPDPNDPDFHLSPKPKGAFDGDFLAEFDAELTEGDSAVVSAYIKKDGELGKLSRTDALASEMFAGLLAQAQATIERLADQLLDGDISVTPYRLNDTSPCSRCPYRSVCRFDSSSDRYHRLEPITKADAMNSPDESIGSDRKPASETQKGGRS